MQENSPNIFQLQLIPKSNHHQLEPFHLQIFVCWLDELSTNKPHLGYVLEDPHQKTVYHWMMTLKDMQDTMSRLFKMLRQQNIK